MHCFTVVERHHPKDMLAELRHSSPKSNASVWLDFSPERVGEDPFAPFRANVGALLEHHALEVPCRLEHFSFMLKLLTRGGCRGEPST